MNGEDIPLTREQLTVVGMAVAVIAVAIASPMLLAPSTTPATDDAKNGTVYEGGETETVEPTPGDDDGDESPIEDLDTDRRQPDADLNDVPDSHVEADGSKPPVSASAGAQTMRISTLTVDGEPALNLTDAREHEGRWVSVDSEWIKSEYGTVPEVVGIAHESGDTYSEPIHARNGKAVFWVRGFSTNVVTFGGQLQINGEPATTGTTHIYEIAELDDATDPEIELTGQVSTERDTKQVLEAANTDSIPLSVAGDNLEPRNPEVTFTGVEQRSTDASLFSSTFGDGESTTYSVDGNSEATDVSVTFSGKSTSSTEAVTQKDLSDGDSAAYTVDGNLPASDVAATVTGQSSETTTTASGSNLANGDTINYDVTGNRDADDVSVTFAGDETTTDRTISETGISPSSSQSIDIGGNLEPEGQGSTDPELTVTATTGQYSHNPYENYRDGDSGMAYDIAGETTDGPWQSELRFRPAESGTLTEISLPIDDYEGSDYGATVDVYLVPETPDANYGEGTQVATWDPDWQTGEQTITLSNPQQVTAGQDYTIELVTRSGDGDSTDDALKLYAAYDSEDGSTWFSSAHPDWSSEERAHVPDFSVSIDQPVNDLSVSDGNGNGATFGNLADGETVTKDIDLERSSGSLDWSGSGGSIDYSLDIRERTATEDPSIDLDGDGTDEASHSGILTGGETATYPVSNLSPGSKTATVSTGHQVDTTIDYTERTATENPAIDIDGDGTNEASYDGYLLDGETWNAAFGDQPPGSHTAVLGLTGSQADLTLSYTDTTATKDPAVDIDDDGQSEASYDGVLLDGENVTRSVENISSGTQTATVSTGHEVGVEAGSTIRTVTEDPTVDIDGDGAAEAEYLGQLADGESQTVQINEFDSSVTDATVGTDEGVVDLQIAYTERAVTEDAGVVINGNPVRMNGTLSQDDTVTLTGDASWLQSGQNNVTVIAGDGDLSTDAPDPRVAITYEHGLTTRRSVTYQDEAFSERYNISRTYLSSRETATLTIPHADNIISFRTLEVRLDQTGGWTEIPQSAMTMDGTELVIDVAALNGGSIPADTTVEIRSTGSKVDVHNGSVTVVETTPVGYDLDSRLRLDDWNDDSWISVRNTSQAELLHYGANESYTAESDYAELSTSHGQRIHFPAATSGSEVGLKTVPLKLSPANGTVRASVPEDQTNATAPVFSVSPGERRGDAFGVEYTGASGGTWYGVYEVDTTKRFDRVQGQKQMAVPTDDIDSLIRVKTAPAPSSDPEPAGSIFEAASEGNFLELSLLFGGVALLIVVGRRPERSRAGIDSIANRAGTLVERVPRGEILSEGVEAAITTVGDAIVTVGENEVLTAAVGLATVAMAIQSGLLQIGPEAGAIGTVAAIALGSLLVLTRTGEFTTARWFGIVIVSAVVALQGLGQGDLLTALVESDAFVLVLILVAYVVIQLVREYRANNSPGDDQPQINIVTNRGGDD